MHATLPLHSESLGQGQPVLFLPGLGGDHRAFAGIQKSLSPNYRCISIDHRDSGSSPRAIKAYTLDDMAADVVALLDSNGIDQADVVGHSMGGMISLHLALAAPDRIRSLVLMSCHPRNYPWKTALVESWVRLRKQLSPIEFAHATLPWLLGPATYENVAHISGMIRHAERHPNPQEADAFTRQALAVLVHDVQDSLHSLDMPILLLSGDSDRVTPPETTRVIADHAPHAYFELIENCGHLPHIESPTRLISLLNRWLPDPTAFLAEHASK
jgi:pimeloyl-ACP methyl ester carboxylesterase